APSPKPRMSGASTRKPSAASLGATKSQVAAASMKPCTSTAVPRGRAVEGASHSRTWCSRPSAGTRSDVGLVISTALRAVGRAARGPQAGRREQPTILWTPPLAHTITLIPGDGIGPEVADATKRVLAASGVAIDWEVQEAGAAVAEKRGTTLPD